MSWTVLIKATERTTLQIWFALGEEVQAHKMPEPPPTIKNTARFAHVCSEKPALQRQINRLRSTMGRSPTEAVGEELNPAAVPI